MALTSLTSQMSENIDYIVTKRQGNFDYFKRVHQGRTHWLNVVKITKAHITKYYPPSKLQKRINRWFILGVSCGKLLELPSGPAVVRALSQLLEEYEYHTSHTKSSDAKAPVTFSSYTPSGSRARVTATTAASDNDPVKPAIRKVGGLVVYDYLQQPLLCIRGAMDYNEVVYSLCDVFSLLYSKFLDPLCQRTPVIHEAVLKLDKKIKQIVLGKMAKDMTLIAAPVMKLELSGLLTNMFVDEGKSNVISKTFFNLSEGEDKDSKALKDDDDDDDDVKEK